MDTVTFPIPIELRKSICWIGFGIARYQKQKELTKRDSVNLFRPKQIEGDKFIALYFFLDDCDVIEEFYRKSDWYIFFVLLE